MKKLTDDEVRAIHKSNLKEELLAKKYGVSKMTIWRIKAGETYQYLRLGATAKYREKRLEKELAEYYERKRAKETQE
jgi:hypothetical protein